MESLHEPNSNFDFSKLLLTSPVNINSGNYFIKYVYDNIPLYLKTPLCRIKQGIINTSKRSFCDLLLTNENENFIQWIEELEQYSQKYIFKNREKWFETELEENDIENSFNSCMKIYKSGKFYCLRVSVPRILGKTNLKIYDEKEQLIDIENIKENDNVMCALEIQGIKCSPRSFQIEIEIKQMLLMNESNLFEKCVLLKKPTMASILEKTYETDEIVTNNEHADAELNVEENNENIAMEVIGISNEKVETVEISNESLPEIHEEAADVSNKVREVTNEIPEVIEESTNKLSNEPIEYEIPLENFDENTMTIKTKSDVYYEMYRNALKKAKVAKDLALASFLEAKNIKNTYMLDDIDDSDLDESFSVESE